MPAILYSEEVIRAFSTLQVSPNTGTMWSTASTYVRFLYCDIHVSTSGSDSVGDGTPKRPYATLLRAIGAALSPPHHRYEFHSVSCDML
jgi:hypothetical protein